MAGQLYFCILLTMAGQIMASKHFLYFLKFFKHLGSCNCFGCCTKCLIFTGG